MATLTCIFDWTMKLNKDTFSHSWFGTDIPRYWFGNTKPDWYFYPIIYSGNNIVWHKEFYKDSYGYYLHTSHNGFVLEIRDKPQFIVTHIDYKLHNMPKQKVVLSSKDKPKNPSNSMDDWEKKTLEGQPYGSLNEDGGILNCKGNVFYACHYRKGALDGDLWIKAVKVAF